MGLAGNSIFAFKFVRVKKKILIFQKLYKQLLIFSTSKN